MCLCTCVVCVNHINHFSKCILDNDISKKIKSIRTQYTRQRTKCRKTPTGTGSNVVYKPSWVHFDKLLFLEDFVTSKSTISNLKVFKLYFNRQKHTPYIYELIKSYCSAKGLSLFQN